MLSARTGPVKLKRFRLKTRNSALAVLFSVWTLLVHGSSSCRANLGDTPEQVKARYGETIYKFDGGSTFRFHRPGVETDTVDIDFQDGKSQREVYFHWKSKALVDMDSTGGFSQADIESVLKANAQGLTWRKQLPNPKDLPGSTKWLLGSNDRKTALAEAVSNDQHHSLALWLLEYDFHAQTDAATANRLAALFPVPTKTPEPARVPIPLKSGAFPVLKILGQSQSSVNKLLGTPSNQRPINKPDKLAGATEIEYADGPHWKFLSTAFLRDKACWINFYFPQPFPTSEDQLFDALGLPLTAFRKTSDNSREIDYRGVANKHVITIKASRPGPRDGVGFCQTVDIELVETLD